MKNEYKEIERKMQKTIDVLVKDLATIRAGRANPAILEKVTVEYYGTATPINQVANISVPEARTLFIQPWDGSILGDVEKAILKSDIGITPNNDGKVIRLNFPPLTEERRKGLVKDIHKKGEEAKISIRGVRRDSLDVYKEQKKKSEITEDDLKSIEKDIQDLTDEHTKKIDEIIDNKAKEVMEV